MKQRQPSWLALFSVAGEFWRRDRLIDAERKLRFVRKDAPHTVCGQCYRGFYQQALLQAFLRERNRLTTIANANNAVKRIIVTILVFKVCLMSPSGRGYFEELGRAQEEKNILCREQSRFMRCCLLSIAEILFGLPSQGCRSWFLTVL